MNRYRMWVVVLCLLTAPAARSSASQSPETELAPNSCSIACSRTESAYPGLSGSVTCGPGRSPVCQCADPLEQIAYCEQSSEEIAQLVRVRRTIQAVRDTGTAMYSWRVDQAASGACDDPPQGPAGGSETMVDLAAIPAIDAAALEGLLVPDYLAELPRTDGWGRDLEFRLRRCPTPGAPTMSVRSAGSDGSYSGTVYDFGAFPTDEPHHDVVWVDGYFGRWPERP